jgi:hypothetical protein
VRNDLGAPLPNGLVPEGALGGWGAPVVGPGVAPVARGIHSELKATTIAATQTRTWFKWSQCGEGKGVFVFWGGFALSCEQATVSPARHLEGPRPSLGAAHAEDGPTRLEAGEGHGHLAVSTATSLRLRRTRHVWVWSSLQALAHSHQGSPPTGVERFPPALASHSSQIASPVTPPPSVMPP